MSAFLCTKRASKDNKDGLVLLQLRCKPQDVPAEIKFGNHGDRYTLTVSFSDDPEAPAATFEGQRVALDDTGDGSVNLKLAALPSQVGDSILYAPNGTVFKVDYEPLYTASDIIPITPEHRASTLRRLHVIMQEPAFWEFLEERDQWGLLKNAFVMPAERHDNALEVLFRLVCCHTRAEIRTNAAVCERTERLIREYRRTQWRAVEKQPLAQAI